MDQKFDFSKTINYISKIYYRIMYSKIKVITKDTTINIKKRSYIPIFIDIIIKIINKSIIKIKNCYNNERNEVKLQVENNLHIMFNEFKRQLEIKKYLFFEEFDWIYDINKNLYDYKKLSNFFIQSDIKKYNPDIFISLYEIGRRELIQANNQKKLSIKYFEIKRNNKSSLYIHRISKRYAIKIISGLKKDFNCCILKNKSNLIKLTYKQLSIYIDNQKELDYYIYKWIFCDRMIV